MTDFLLLYLDARGLKFSRDDKGLARFLLTMGTGNRNRVMILQAINRKLALISVETQCAQSNSARPPGGGDATRQGLPPSRVSLVETAATEAGDF